MSPTLKDVFVISERDGEERSFWSRIGVAFVNKDQSLNVVLDAIPLSGRLHIRDRLPKKINKTQEMLLNKAPDRGRLKRTFGTPQGELRESNAV